MAIERFENLSINHVTNGTDSVGEYTTTITKWFDTRGKIRDVANSLRISERYRVYQDLVNITLNYTPNIKAVVDSQNLYSITWRGFDWRITDIQEANDRMTVKFICYRNDPTTPV